MGVWYEKFERYCKKVNKTIKEIENKKFHPESPGTFSKKYISIKSFSDDGYIDNGQEKLKVLLYKLQFFPHLNNHPTDPRGECEIKMNILGQRITFYLRESFVPSSGKKSVRGKQILFKVKENGKKKMIEYSDIMPALEAYSSTELGYALFIALNSSQSEQTSEGLSESIIRPATLFLLLTHIPEAAIPFKETLKEFERAVLYNTDISKKPNDKIVDIKKKTGRVPMADKIARKKLRDVALGKVTFKETFNITNYPIRKKGGTHEGRKWVLCDEEGDLTGDLSDSEDESSTLSKFKLEYKNPLFLPES